MASLMHDAVVDDAGARRGRPTAGSVYGTGLTSLAGDYLLAKSIHILARNDQNLNLIRLFAGVTVGMTEGEVLQASVSGDVLTLPTSDIPVSVVLGYEHRADSSSFRPDSFLSSGDVLGFNAGKPTVGGYSSADFFGEISIPVMQGQPMVEELTLWAAARTSDYSNIGSVGSFAAAINYSPIEMVGFRVGYQEAVRAPNVSELFLGQSNGFPSASDPCASNGFIAGTTDAALCQATGVAAADVGVFVQANSQIQGNFGGNPNLKEETSNTFTVGAVIQPMDGLDITVDYYNIEIEDAISVLGGFCLRAMYRLYHTTGVCDKGK